MPINITIENNFLVLTDTVTGEEVFSEPKAESKVYIYSGQTFGFETKAAGKQRYGNSPISYPFTELTCAEVVPFTFANLKTYLRTELSAPISVTGGGAGVSLGTTSTTAHRGDHGVISYDHSLVTGNPHDTTPADLGLGSVDNTRDVDKPVSTAQATAIGLKEDSANKSTLTADSASSVKYPVWSAIVAFFSASQIRSILGITTLNGSNTGDETIATIQTKRPLKTVNGNSLEGTGDVVISGSGGGGLSHQQTMSRISIGF